MLPQKFEMRPDWGATRFGTETLCPLVNKKSLLSGRTRLVLASPLGDLHPVLVRIVGKWGEFSICRNSVPLFNSLLPETALTSEKAGFQPF